MSLSLAIGAATKAKTNEDMIKVIKEAEDNMYEDKSLKNQIPGSKIIKLLL